MSDKSEKENEKNSIEFQDLKRESDFVGNVYDMDYGSCDIHTNDFVKYYECGGIPRNCFLIATVDRSMLHRDDYAQREPQIKDHILLLRVREPTDLPISGEVNAMRHRAIENEIADRFSKDSEGKEIQKTVKEQMQKTGIKADIVGTFKKDDGGISFETDAHTPLPAGGYTVRKPRGESLEEIVNFTGRYSDIEDESEVIPVEIGEISYSGSGISERESKRSTVEMNASDLVGTKTGVFGMTRTGKSNTVKILASMIHKSRDDVGQLIFDPQGEYANTNEQDSLSIYDIEDQNLLDCKSNIHVEDGTDMKSDLLSQDNIESAIRRAKRQARSNDATYQDDIINILVKSKQEPAEMYMEFHNILTVVENQNKLSKGENYYLIEIENESTPKKEYMIELRELPSDVVFYIPKFSFEFDLSYQQMNDCYTVADLIEERTTISDDYEEIQIAMSILCLYLMDLGKIDDASNEFNLLGHQISKNKFTEIGNRIDSELQVLEFEIDDSQDNQSAFEW